MRHLIAKQLDWYTEHKSVKLQNQFGRFMAKFEKKEQRLDQLYTNIQNWIEGAD